MEFTVDLTSKVEILSAKFFVNIRITMLYCLKGYFPKDIFPSDNFLSGSFPNVQFPK